MARNSSSIQLVFFNNGKRIKMATGMDIKPSMWVEDLMRARIHFSNPESNVINERLDALESAVNHIEYDIKMRRVNISSNEFIEYGDTVDQSFFQSWFRGKYATSIRKSSTASHFWSSSIISFLRFCPKVCKSLFLIDLIIPNIVYLIEV